MYWVRDCADGGMAGADGDVLGVFGGDSSRSTGHAVCLYSMVFFNLYRNKRAAKAD